MVLALPFAPNTTHEAVSCKPRIICGWSAHHPGKDHDEEYVALSSHAYGGPPAREQRFRATGAGASGDAAEGVRARRRSAWQGRRLGADAAGARRADVGSRE